MTTTASRVPPFPNLHRWFRFAAIATLAALALTGAMLALRADAWRIPFVAAHLAALLALLPLGAGIVIHAYRNHRRFHPTPTATLRAIVEANRLNAAIVAIILVAAGISISQFTGVRVIRASANAVTVTLVLTLVVRYFRWRASAAKGA